MDNKDYLAPYKIFQEQLQTARQWQSKLLFDVGSLILISNFLVSLIFPLFEVLVSFVSPYLPGAVSVPVFMLLIAGHIIFGVFSYLGTMYVHRFSSQLDLNQLEKEYGHLVSALSKQKDNIEFLVNQATATQYSLTTVQQFIANRQHPFNLEKDIDRMIDPLFLRRKIALQFNGGRYDFALYLYNRESKKLERAWRNSDRDLQHIPQNRSWSPGEGFIGGTFVRPLGYWICPDTTALDPNSNIFRQPAEKITDTENYASFIGVAFGAGDPQSRQGVLIISSSLKGQFKEEPYTPLAEALKVILTLYFIHYRRAA